MNAALNKAVSGVPDVWFDWYARFIPGCVTVALFYFLNGGEIPDRIGATQLTLFLIGGYFIGFLIQPPAGWAVKRAEEHIFRQERDYEAAKRAGANPKVVSKIRAEANGMCTLAIVSAIYGYLFWRSGRGNIWIVFLPSLYFFWATWDRLTSRNRKILGLKER